jgi:protein disulfide isomerase family A protein 3
MVATRMFVGVLLLCAVVGMFAQVQVLTTSNFDSILADTDVALVEFFAPWCGHCKKLVPEYEKAAKQLKSSNPDVMLATVDATEEGSLAQKYGVSGYPTLKIFRKGVESGPYEGGCDAASIVKVMRKQAAPASMALKSAADMQRFLAFPEYAVVGFFDSEDETLYSAFKTVAEGNRDDFRFAYTTDAAVTAEFGQANSIIVFQPKQFHNKLEDAKVTYDGKPNAKSIKSFIEDKTAGLVVNFTPDNEKRVQARRPLLIVFMELDWVKDASGARYIRNRVLKVANEVSTDLTFALANIADFAQFQQTLAVKPGRINVAILDAEGSKFKMDGEFSPKTLAAFVEAYNKKELEPYIKSDYPPASNDEPVKVVVGKTFKEIVEQDKDVLIEFYAPWCGHCKSLAPKWDELATKLSNDDNIVIAKLDATANDYPPYYAVQGYPTIYFAPKGSKKTPKKYEGAREVKDFLDYLKKNASSPPKISKKDEL